MFPASESIVSLKPKSSKKKEKLLQKQLKRIEDEKKQISDHLEREKTFNVTSNLRGRWTDCCETLKSSDMLEDFQATSLKFKGLFDRSNHALETLQEDRLKAEEHHTQSLQNLSDLIDCITGLTLLLKEKKPSALTFKFQKFTRCSVQVRISFTRQNVKVCCETFSWKL
jgi:hypothetical protein